MAWYTLQDDSWSQQSSPPPGGFCLHVRAENTGAPEVRALADGQEFFHLSGVTPRPTADTTHTVARIDPDTATGVRLFAVHADGRDLTFEDRRPDDHRRDRTEQALQHARSSLNEILVPVYIDDVIEELSERVSGLVALHTAQYEDEKSTSWTYFRTSVFDDGDLALEEEYGSI